MLRLLLDANISYVVADEVRRHEPTCPIDSVFRWENGAYLMGQDEEILAAAQRQGLTLVSRDRRTIEPIVVAWGAVGRPHAGVIFVDDRTVPDGNVGVLVRALLQVWHLEAASDWRNRSDFLRRAE